MIFVFIGIQLNEKKKKKIFDRRNFFLVIDFIKKKILFENELNIKKYQKIYQK